MMSKRRALPRIREERVTPAICAIISFATIVHCLGAPVDGPDADRSLPPGAPAYYRVQTE